VMHGTAASRDLVSSPITVQERVTGEYRIDVESKPAPTTRVATPKESWMQAFGNARVLEGIQAAQVSRPSEFGLPLGIRQRYPTLTIGRYGNIEGTDTIGLVARANEDVTEQMQFDRQTGLLRRRVIQTRTPFGNLVEQVDYSDYRDVSGVKVPFNVHYATWNQATTIKIADVKINAPIDEALFVKK